MQGKTVVITGATSGIGGVAAEKLAQMGARIVLVARDRSRGEGTLARLREKPPGLAHAVHYADLTRISELKRVAAEVAEAVHSLLVCSKKWSALRAWGMKIAKRRCMSRARVAVARKLAAILHRRNLAWRLDARLMRC